MHRGGERVCEQIELYAHHWSVISAAVSSSRLRDTVRSEINMRAAKIFVIRVYHGFIMIGRIAVVDIECVVYIL